MDCKIWIPALKKQCSLKAVSDCLDESRYQSMKAFFQSPGHTGLHWIPACCDTWDGGCHQFDQI